MYGRQIVAVVSLTLVMGCATLAPERHLASRLVGKSMDDAIALLGSPSYSQVDTEDWKHGGKIVHHFTRRTGTVGRSELVGSVGPYGIYSHYVTGAYCTISLWANEQRIVDYYEVQGGCGSWFMTGNTGQLHRYGIN